jgi:hypothetical protein
MVVTVTAMVVLGVLGVVNVLMSAGIVCSLRDVAGLVAGAVPIGT